MHISLNIKNESLSRKILDFLSSFKQEDVQIDAIIEDEQPEKESLSAFAGLWKDRAVDIETLRESAWKK